MAEHTRLLAESEAALPPILVTRDGLRVVDGMHRLRAAQLRGEETVEVEFFDGDDAEAFVAAVKANTSHGLPLALADREAAAARIIASHPRLSDRAIGLIAGLSARTVAGIRRRTPPETDQVLARIGRDGRVRPLNSADARRTASEVIAKHPDASLRHVARLAGLSPATVRDVRERIRRGDDPVPERQRDAQQKPEPPSRNLPSKPAVDVSRNRAELLGSLVRDPSLRFTESGRATLRWLQSRACGPDGWEQVVGSLPPHCAYVVADVARVCAAEWMLFAERLNQRLQNSA